MGTYLSTPNKEKQFVSGTDPENDVAWSAVEMQGWRAHMEDAHVARRLTASSYLFAVLDGHGGSQVSRFCSTYLGSVVLHESVTPNSTAMDVLERSFHHLDRLLVEREMEVLAMKDFAPTPGEQRSLKVESRRYIPPEALAALEAEKARKEVEAKAAAIAKNGGGSPYLVDLDDHFDKHAVGQQGKNGGSQLSDTDDYDEEDFDIDNQIDIEVLDPNTNEKGTRTMNAEALRRLLLQSHVTPLEQRSVTEPAVVMDGKLLCNLPEHSIPSGTTAIVVWYFCGKELVVANAGDSRAVLCRAGQAVALSHDHKPLQARERQRIEGAGGFINSMGRVNGNLNLSRCIGDLKYKQHPNLSPANQIITAQPDLQKFPLGVFDDFVILGCDGIWDCLSNQEAVDYVRKRIDTERPAAIGSSLLDSILATKNPREARGIGCDNMTLLIVDLKAQRRSYYKSSTPSSEIEI